nr:hypothetical protein [Paraburkholderia guartelaensis]
MSVDSLDEFFDAHRLSKENGPTLLVLHRFWRSGEHQHRCSSEARTGPYHQAQLHAVNVWHLIVSNETLNAFSTHKVHGSPRVPRDVHAVATVLECQREGARIFRFIINQQDVRHKALHTRFQERQPKFPGRESACFRSFRPSCPLLGDVTTEPEAAVPRRCFRIARATSEAKECPGPQATLDVMRGKGCE